MRRDLGRHNRRSVGGAPPFTPANIFPASVGQWISAYDGTYMTVNTDGTGGQPAVGGSVGRLTDRSGNNIHMTQLVVANRQSGYLAFPYGIGVTRSAYTSTANAINTWTARDNCGLFIADCMGSIDLTTPADYDAAGVTGFILWAGDSPQDGKYRVFNGSAKSTTLKWSQTRTYIAWRSTASGFEVEIDGTRTTITALTAAALSTILLGKQSGGASQKMRFYEQVLVKGTLSDANFNGLCQYGKTQSGYADSNDRLLLIGDSLTGGAGSLTYTPYVYRLAQMPLATKYVMAREGYFAYVWLATYPTATYSGLYKGSGRNVVVVWLGTNDFAVPKTPVEIEAALNAICTSYRALGWKVVICTLQDVTGQTANVLTLNGLIIANASTYSDAVANLGGNANLQNSANTTYFASDGVHLLDAGYAIVGTIIDAAIASIP